MRSWILLCCCFVALNTSAQTGFKPVANLELFSQQFMKTARSTNTIKSDFVQEKNLSMLSEKIVSKGKFWFKKENKVRMEYSAPSYYLMGSLSASKMRKQTGIYPPAAASSLNRSVK
jgi:outer membrane lipoprotein-sorting protein